MDRRSKGVVHRGSRVQENLTAMMPDSEGKFVIRSIKELGFVKQTAELEGLHRYQEARSHREPGPNRSPRDGRIVVEESIQSTQEERTIPLDISRSDHDARAGLLVRIERFTEISDHPGIYDRILVQQQDGARPSYGGGPDALINGSRETKISPVLE
jgi:hypothetical protein